MGGAWFGQVFAERRASLERGLLDLGASAFLGPLFEGGRSQVRAGCVRRVRLLFKTLDRELADRRVGRPDPAIAEVAAGRRQPILLRRSGPVAAALTPPPAAIALVTPSPLRALGPARRHQIAADFRYHRKTGVRRLRRIRRDALAEGALAAATTTAAAPSAAFALFR